MSVPAVSIIIPAYNSAPFIGETLESLFAQTFRDFEAIVINDGSPDDIEAALTPYLDRIIYVRQENRGPGGARNTGLRQARGRYIALLDNDDLWMPTYLERLVGMLEDAPNAAAAFPNAVLFGSTPLAGKLYQDIYPCSPPVTFERILTRECNIFCGLVFRRNVIDDVGMFDEGVLGVDDFDFWLRMSQCGNEFLFTTEPLVRYRRHERCLSHSGIIMLRSYIKVLEKVTAAPATTAEQHALADTEVAKVRAQLNLAIGKQLLSGKEFRSAAKHFELANTDLHSVKLALVTLAIRIAPGWVHRLYTLRTPPAVR